MSHDKNIQEQVWQLGFDPIYVLEKYEDGRWTHFSSNVITQALSKEEADLEYQQYDRTPIRIMRVSRYLVEDQFVSMECIKLKVPTE